MYHWGAAEISILAPSRERPAGGGSKPAPSHFNPRSLTGATLSHRQYMSLAIQFQSSLPHGSDKMPLSYTFDKYAFQSSLPHGSDDNKSGRDILYVISILAPSRERRFPYGRGRCTCNFNPRSLTGATGLGNSFPKKPSLFQSSLPHGSDITPFSPRAS